jgi:sigma-B regulation protein RsbU (phosphoserine phosphatase)
MFGTERFNHELMNSADKSVADAGSDIVDCIDTFAVGTPQSDDITLMLLDIPRDKVPTSVPATRGSRTFNLDGQLTTSSGEWLEHFLKQAGTAPDIIMEMTLVLEELVTNVRKYAGLPDDAEVTVEISAGEESVVLTIVDAGAAFNPLEDGQRSTLGADIDSAEIGGLGVHLATQLTDEQSYRREGDKNLLQVVKRLQST